MKFCLLHCYQSIVRDERSLGAFCVMFVTLKTFTSVSVETRPRQHAVGHVACGLF